MGVERSTIFMDIFARLSGRGFKDLEREARGAEDAVDDLDGASARLTDSTPESLRALRAQKEGLEGVAVGAHRARHALVDLSRGRHRLEDLLPAGGGKVEQAGHNIGVRAGAAMARGMAAALVDGSGMIGRALTSIPPQAQAAIVGGVALMALPIGAALNGAILAALSGGAVAAGVALAARDPRVKEAGSVLGRELMAGLTKESHAFVPATLDAINIVRKEFRGASDDIGGFFDAASAHVGPLVKGLTGLVTNALPGITKALQNSGPAVDALADGLAGLGRTAGDALAMMSTQSDGAAQGLRSLFTVMQVGITTIASTVTGLSFLYDKLEFLRPAWLMYLDNLSKSNVQHGVAAEAVRRLRAPLDEAGVAADGTAVKVQSLTERLREMSQGNIDAFNAETRFQEAVDRATAAVKSNGATLDENTKKGRANRDALSALASDTIRARDAIATMTGSQGKANEVMQAGYNKFVAVAVSMGMSKRAADALARSMGLIPPTTNTTHKSNAPSKRAETEHLRRKLAEIDRTFHSRISVTVSGAESAIARINRVQSAARAASGNVNIRVGGSGRGGHLERATGGPVYAGRTYMVGERGPELVTPHRNGHVIPATQTRAMLGGGRSTGGGNSLDVVNAIVQALSRMQVVMDSRAVGWMQARTGDVYARGG